MTHATTLSIPADFAFHSQYRSVGSFPSLHQHKKRSLHYGCCRVSRHQHKVRRTLTAYVLPLLQSCNQPLAIAEHGQYIHCSHVVGSLCSLEDVKLTHDHYSLHGHADRLASFWDLLPVSRLISSLAYSVAECSTSSVSNLCPPI